MEERKEGKTLTATAYSSGKYKGVLNVIRFNWPFYAIGSATIGLLFLFARLSSGSPALRLPLFIFACLGLLNLFLSVLVSHYVYDRSDIYRFKWLQNESLPQNGSMALIHAGFDETSGRLKQLFPQARWSLCDFYNPLFNTEASIQRARKYHPPTNDTLAIDHRHWKLDRTSLDVVLCLFAVHELRNASEQIAFFQEAAEALKPGGRLILAEHVRDLPNFTAFGIGFLHFFSNEHWRTVFAAEARFELRKSYSVTPFVHIFILQKN